MTHSHTRLFNCTHHLYPRVELFSITHPPYKVFNNTVSCSNSLPNHLLFTEPFGRSYFLQFIPIKSSLYIFTIIVTDNILYRTTKFNLNFWSSYYSADCINLICPTR